MSDARLSGAPERVARVWQPSDFFQPGGPGERFMPRRWEGAPEHRQFTPQSIPAETTAAPPEPDALPAAQPATLLELPLDSAAADPDAPRVSAQAVEEARLEAYAQGLAHGRREAQAQVEADQQQTQQVLGERLKALQEAVSGLSQSPERLHEPLKRLALHLAEQLVLGELTQSPQAIERLVARCVDELAAAKAAPVLIELNPGDLALLQPWLAREDGADTEGRTPRPWVLQPNEALRPGSVRASANDAVVSDLIEHRLDALARQLQVDAQRVARQSALGPERLAARRADVDTVLDAHPRMADAPRSARFAPVVEVEAVEAQDAAKALNDAEAGGAVQALDAVEVVDAVEAVPVEGIAPREARPGSQPNPRDDAVVALEAALPEADAPSAGVDAPQAVGTSAAQAADANAAPAGNDAPRPAGTDAAAPDSQTS